MASLVWILVLKQTVFTQTANCSKLSSAQHNEEEKMNHLHLPLLDVGWLSVATEEPFVVRPHQARKRTQQQLEEDKRHNFIS